MNKVSRLCCNVTLFKILFLISALLYTLPIVNVFGVYAVKVLLIWGLLLIFWLLYKGKLNVDNVWFVAFVIFAFLSVFVNYNSGFSRNIKDLLYLLIELFVLTATAKEKNTQKNLVTINHVIIFVLAVGNIISILLFLFQIHSIPGLPKTYMFSYVDGRLWGWCGNPNTLAYMSIFSLVAMYINYDVYRKKAKKKALFCFYIANTILSLSCLALSASRSGMIGFFAILVILVIRPYSLHKTNCFKRILVCFGVCVISMVGLKGLERGLKYLPDYIVFQQVNVNIPNEGREFGEDVSNGRFELWKGGLQVTKEHLLFGVGQDSLNEKANVYLAPSYVRKYPRIASNMHNIYLQIIATMGIFTLVSFILMHLLSIIKHLKEVFTYKIKTALFAMVASILLMNFFDSNIIGFMNLFLCSIFWIYFGFYISEEIIEDNNKKKVVFMINNLGVGGAENVLVNIVNNFDLSKFSVTIKTLFNEGAFKDKLIPEIKYQTIIKKPSRLKKALLWRFVKYSPSFCIQYLIRDNADIVVAFLEGMPTKIVGSIKGNKNLYCWIHTDIVNNDVSETNFRDRRQAISYYGKFSKIVCVSNDSKNRFSEVYPECKEKIVVIYNCLDTERIVTLSEEEVTLPFTKKDGDFIICCVGRLIAEKGYARLIETIDKLCKDHYSLKLMIVGDGIELDTLRQEIRSRKLEDDIYMLGYQANPYAYMKQADIFVCSSFVEGFSLVVMESLIVGTPVLSTSCAGPVELLANECGIVCENSLDALYTALKAYIENPRKFDCVNIENRLSKFSIKKIVNQIESLLGGD